MLETLLLAGSVGRGPVSVRVNGERAVERARYRFVIGATQPFDEVYPRSVFEKRVAREIAEERVLRQRFGITITQRMLRAELGRIETSTQAPDQWAAIKKALGDDPKRIEEIFCRPLVVERALRAKFAFDPRIHLVPHDQARNARASFLSGRSPAGVSRIRLSRTGSRVATTTQLLERATAEASVPRVLPSPEEKKDAPIPVDPEMALVLERELQKPGDVTTILEERDRFSVFRLIEKRDEAWKVEAVTFPKVDFDTWFEKVRRSS